MNPNENDRNEGLNDTSDLEHIKEIEDMLARHSNAPSHTEPSQAPVRKYVRKRPQDADTSAPKAEFATQVVDITKIKKSAELEDTKKHDTARRESDTPAMKAANDVKRFDTDKKKETSTDAKTAKNGDDISTRHSVAKNTRKDEDYTPLLTENDDFEIDEDPEPEFTSGALGALTSVAKAVIYLVAVLAVSIALALAIINVANDVFAFVKDEEPVTVVVPENCDTEELARLLAESKAIKYPSVFKLYIEFKGKEEEYVPGTYSISPMLNYDYMIAEFKPKAAARTEVVVTIPEGYSTDQIVALLVEKGLGTLEGYKRAINEYDFDYKFLENVDDFSSDRFWRLDGYLYPDTYYYYSDSTEETVIYKMLENFNNKFTEEYYERANELGMTVDELITLASMIQKEVRYADEFGNVSSVFHNRLNNLASFPHLDSDATIIYAIEHDTSERPETLSDTSYDSPYNTYKCIGLPPGPIANPSMEAIRYAMYPNETSYYYFVSGPDGRTVFLRTYAEHLKAIDELY